ncbi:glutamate-rich protein 3 [Hippopotamus amphibius kiboko]|uniref:glutamate-rich protein 3 n=1 Tax=Hippopotamus amphibius kiboko TaxID=575201 RepID=UPI0025924BD4|nr:glutamate-rich protein 3 [Hippopotamus amphibius kiboko]
MTEPAETQLVIIHSHGKRCFINGIPVRDPQSFLNRKRLLAAYNSLTDKHLAGYFNNTRIRRHLLRSGLITRNGRILSEKEYKLNIMKRDHQKYIRECLAQAIFHKVLEMERYHQLEIKKKLETLARKERIQRFKGEHTRWTMENNMPILSPHPPVGPKTNRGHSVLVDEGHSSPVAPTAPRPYTAPGNMQPPIRLQPLPSNPAVGTAPKVTSGSRSKTSLLENEAPFSTGGKKAVMKFRNSMDNSQGMNRYQFPDINCYMMPIPPPLPPPSGKITRESRPETWRRRRFRPTTAPNGLEPLFTRDPRRIHKTPLHSNAAITMIYLGKNVHLAYDHSDFRDEIKVYQQHCGGENLCVYTGKLLEKETFQFISKRHHGFPFSLTFFLNGIQVNRLSSCCEYKHRKGSRLGGKRGYFGFVCVERSSPCYKCIIAMGLDKKTTSPKPRKEKSIEKREGLKKGEGKLRKDREYLIPRRREMEGSKTSASVIFSAQELHTGSSEVRTAVEEMKHKEKPGQDVWEDDQENIFKYEYEEDFEADEEKQDEKADGEGQADDQVNEMSKSPSDDEKDLLNPEKESETSLWKAPDADDTVKDEGDGCSESDSEEDKDIKTASSTSSRSHPYSSCSEDESALGDRESHAENSPNKSVRSASSQELSENDEPGKTYLPIEDSLEIEDREIMKADVETKPLPIEENLENVLEDEAEKGTQVIAEGLAEKSREHVSREEKEKSKSKLWEGSTAKVKDKKAGPHRVDKGVGQLVAEAVDPGHHCHYDSEAGVSSTDGEERHSRKLEIDTGAAPNRNLVVEERAALSLNKESKEATSEEHKLEKKEAVEGDEGPQYRDADTEEKGDAALWGKAGVNEVPLGQWTPTVEQPALEGPFTEERELPQGGTSRAGAEAEGGRRQDEEVLDSRGQRAARDSGGLKEGTSSEEQALVQTPLEAEKAASGGEQGVGHSVLVSQAVALREAVRPEKGESERVAVSEARSAKPGVEDSEEEASTDLEDAGPVEDAASDREEGLEEATLGGEEPAEDREAVVRTETPLSSSTSEKAEATRMGVSEDSLEELCKDHVEREEAETESESNKEDERKERLPKELDAARERKAERPKTPPGETESEREEVTRAKVLQDEDTLEEEQKFKGENGELMKEVRTKEETRSPHDDKEHGAEVEAATGAPETTEDPGPRGEDSRRETEVTMFEAAPGFEKSLENITVWKKEGEGERLREARDTGHRGRAEGILGEGPGPAGEGVSGAPESEPVERAQTPGAAGEAQGCADRDQDSLMGWEGGDKEGPLQGPEGVAVTAMTQEDVPEGDSMMAVKLSEEVMDEDPEEGADEEGIVGPGVKNRDTEGDGSLQGIVVAAEDLVQGGGGAETATEAEVLAGSKTAEGKTEANKGASFSDVTGEESWHKVGETLGETAAAEKVAVEEIALSREEVPAVEELTASWVLEAEVEAPGKTSDLEGKAPQPGPAREGEEADTMQEAGSVGSRGQLKNSDRDYPKREGQSPGERVHKTQKHSLESPIAQKPKRSKSVQCREEVRTQMFP